MKKKEILDAIEREGIQDIELRFSDVLGSQKNLTLNAMHIATLLDHGTNFDGSSVKGVARIEESDMSLDPDLGTFRTYATDGRRKAMFFCNARKPDGNLFDGDPRYILQRQIRRMRRAYDSTTQFLTAPEIEFYVARLENGTPVFPDRAGYFDINWDSFRTECTDRLRDFGIEYDTHHQEVGPGGQHEIGMVYTDALTMADQTMLYKRAVWEVAKRHGWDATFMPKIHEEKAGSGMHTHMNIRTSDGNPFCSHSRGGDRILSQFGKYFIGGILAHARGMTAYFNPTVNSYKRLGSDEAPKLVAWANHNRSSLVRVPAVTSDNALRIELRSPDPLCNPYIGFALMLAAGLDGVENKISPGKPADGINLYDCGSRYPSLPGSLDEAMVAMENDYLVKKTVGPTCLKAYRDAKIEEIEAYRRHVSAWELQWARSHNSLI